MRGRKTKNSIGYTTGTCAAAAAKAATLMLFSQKEREQIKVNTPCGIIFSLPLVESWVDEAKAGCGVVKDAGSDPDITHGIRIYAEARVDSQFQYSSSPKSKVQSPKSGQKIVVKGGEGVGVATKPGLSVPMGAPAINPVPLRMIEESMMEVFPYPSSFALPNLKVTIFVPEGEKKAKKTFNPKLGIIGGISILGTMGIVRPMSDESWKDSLLPQISIAKELGCEEIVLTPGNMGERVAQRLGFAREAIVQISNFVGFMLDACLKKDIKKVLFLGHIGKTIKVAEGNFNTHHRHAKLNLGMMYELAEEAGASPLVLQKLQEAVTAEESATILKNCHLEAILEEIAMRAQRKMAERVGNRMKIGVALTNITGEVIGIDAAAREWVGNLK